MAASSPLSLSSIFSPKPPYSLPPHNSYSSHHAPLLAFSPTQSHRLNSQTRTAKIWKRAAINENFWVSEASTVEASREIVTTASDDGVSNIISALLLFAFIGLSILTIGVVYIAVTDFLQKREREKFEKEEGAKKKKKKTKKGKVMRGRGGGGPKGFGQKVEDDDDDDEEED